MHERAIEAAAKALQREIFIGTAEGGGELGEQQ